MGLGQLGRNFAAVLQNFPIVELQKHIQAFGPVFHCHGDFSAGTVFSQLQIGIDDAPQGIQLVLFQIVLGNTDVCFQYFAVGSIGLGSKSHMGLPAVGTLMNKLRCSLTVDGVMQLVLHLGKEGFTGRGVLVVVHAGCVDIGDFLVEAPFA